MITFTETTGILNQDDIRRKTRIWQFDASSGKVKRTWWISDAEFKCDEEDYDNSIPLTINTFTNRYLDASVGRCAALNGTENFVLMADGGWDKPLHDGDMVGLVPAVGIADWIIYAYIAVMAVMLVYCIYMIATMKTGDGAGSTKVYSLSSMTNQKRPGEIVERQYGYLKRQPSYAANPYTKYVKNVQWLYAIFCVGTGKFQFDAIDPYGFENTNWSEYSDVSITVIQPNGYASAFDNNITTSSEVADGLELIPYNEGANDDWEEPGYVGPNGYTNFSTPYGAEDGWYGWFSANDVGTACSKLMFDFSFPNGLGHTKKNGDAQSYTVSWQAQYRSMTANGDGSITYGTPVTLSYSKKKATNGALRYTMEVDVPAGAYQVRARRTSQRNALHSANGQRTRETLQWTALRAKLPNKTSFGNRTIIMLKARAQNGLTDSAAKRFYVKGTGYSPIYNTTTKVWTDTPNRNPVWAACDMLRSSNGGNYPDSMLALDHLASWAAWCDTNQVYFDYCFDDQSDIDTQMKVALRVMRASPIYTNGQFHILRDEQVTIPTEIFTPANIVSGSLKIQYKGQTDDDYDGLRVEYADPEDDFNTNTVDCLRSGSTGSNLKTTTMKGCCDRTRAYRLGMYEWITEIENRAAISFTSTKVGWQCEPGAMIYLNHPMFRQHDDGRIIAISGTTVTLDRNVKLNSEYNNILLIRNCKTGGELGRYVATYATEGDYHTLTLDAAPDATGMEFNDPQALPVFALGIATNFAKKCRVTKTQNKQDGTDIECFIDTDARFAYDASYPDTGSSGSATGSSLSEYATGIDGPHEFAWDPSGYMYVSAMDGDSVVKFASDGTYTTFASGIDAAHGMVFDASGNLYVSSLNAFKIYKIASDGTKSVFATDVGKIYGMVFDESENLYAASFTKNCIYKITSDGIKSEFASGISGATGIAWDSDKSFLYCASYSSGMIYKISADGSSMSTFASGLGQVYEIAFDSYDNLYATRYYTSSYTATGLWKISSSGDITSFADICGAHDLAIRNDIIYVGSFEEDQVYSVDIYGNIKVLAYGIDGVYGVSFDDNGRLWIAGYNSDSIYQLLWSATLSAPANVTVAPYDPESTGTPTDITISWDTVSGFDTYIVQYSQDGETWTTLSGSTTATSALVGSYMSGYFYARVAVVYNGCIWSWGESAATWMPSSTLGFIYVTSDNFIDTTSDGYKMVFQGES